jgi:hypothetical protein
LLSLKSFVAKEACGYVKVVHKKGIGKNGQVSELLKQWVLR